MMLRTAEDHNWRGYATSEIGNIAACFETYDQEYGQPPTSLTQVMPLGANGFLQDIVAGKSGTSYEIHSLTNAYIVTATKPSRWIFASKHLELRFKRGDGTRTKRLP